jgi:hypothetical protein
LLRLTYTFLRPGVDIICAQGGEGGGHTGDTPFSILIPAVVDLCKDAKSPFTGQPIIVVAAGGISDGRGLAVALSYAISRHPTWMVDGCFSLVDTERQVSGSAPASLLAKKLGLHQSTRSLFSPPDTTIQSERLYTLAGP